MFEPIIVEIGDRWHGEKLHLMWGTKSSKGALVADHFLCVAMKIGIITPTTYYGNIL